MALDFDQMITALYEMDRERVQVDYGQAKLGTVMAWGYLWAHPPHAATPRKTLLLDLAREEGTATPKAASFFIERDAFVDAEASDNWIKLRLAEDGWLIVSRRRASD